MLSEGLDKIQSDATAAIAELETEFASFTKAQAEALEAKQTELTAKEVDIRDDVEASSAKLIKEHDEKMKTLLEEADAKTKAARETEQKKAEAEAESKKEDEVDSGTEPNPASRGRNKRKDRG